MQPQRLLHRELPERRRVPVHDWEECYSFLLLVLWLYLLLLVVVLVLVVQVHDREERDIVYIVYYMLCYCIMVSSSYYYWLIQVHDWEDRDMLRYTTTLYIYLCYDAFRSSQRDTT